MLRAGSTPGRRFVDVPLRPATHVQTVPVVALGLLGGFTVARETGIRALGGVVLGAAGVYAGRTWLARRGPAVTIALSALYVSASAARTRWPSRSVPGRRCWP
jgi:hypothetical protein